MKYKVKETEMADKIYLAFISSEYERLRKQRNAIIDILLDFDIMPIGMEHFTTSYDGNFSDIEIFIDQSDFFILLMSDNYGSTDANGISWTEREFDYAVKKNKKILAIVTMEFSQKLAAVKNAKEKGTDLSEIEIDDRQLRFHEKVAPMGFARSISEDFDLKKILTSFFGSKANYQNCPGWIRTPSEMTESELAEWQEANKAYDLRGTWYHLHLNSKDKNYIRVGTVTIRQEFTPNGYKDLSMLGENFSIRYYDVDKKMLNYNRDEFSEFSGDYSIDDSGKILGIFNTKRFYKGTFNAEQVTDGTRRGIHEFYIKAKKSQPTETLFGYFHDEAPSPKMGQIYLFKDEAERDLYAFSERGKVIEYLCKKNGHKLSKGFKPTRNEE